jgi:hypothetical protein
MLKLWVGCWLLAAGCWAAGCWLLAAGLLGCWLLAAGCWLLVACVVERNDFKKFQIFKRAFLKRQMQRYWYKYIKNNYLLV